MLYLKVGMIVVLMVLMVNGQQYDDNVPAEELSAVLRALLQPENFKYEMHRKSLENALENMLEAARDSESDEYEQYDEDEKRSIATLAKNGQLPTVGSPDVDETLSEDDNGHKRNLASMARSGMIGGKRNIQSLARQLNYGSGKRNIGAVMRNNMFPESGKRNLASIRNGKRSIGYMRNTYGKRNVGTLARDWVLPKFTGSKYMDDGKRNIQSMKNQVKGRKKREIGEALEPVYQTGPLDYEELLQSLSNDDYLQNPAEKRYLETSPDPSTTTITSGFQKRHIGAMARSGWTFRPTLNRFSRSGRTSKMDKIVEYFYPLDLQQRPATAISCKRCELDKGVRSQWGLSDNSLRVGSLASAVRTRSGFRSTPPRVTALSWRDRL